jgi:hypothetical protein
MGQNTHPSENCKPVIVELRVGLWPRQIRTQANLMAWATTHGLDYIAESVLFRLASECSTAAKAEISREVFHEITLLLADLENRGLIRVVRP